MVVPNVRFRPLTASEIVALTDVSIEMWKLTAPPVAAVLNISPTGQVEYTGPETNGVVAVFEIDGGIEPFTDASGQLFKVTVMCKRQQVTIA
jgi:hypothetical protein